MNKVRPYRTVPHVIYAIEYTVDNKQAVFDFVDESHIGHPSNDKLSVWCDFLQDEVTVDPGDFILRDNKGRFEVYEPEMFKEYFKEV